MKSRYLLASAVIAIVASGAVATAQEAPKRDQNPAAERAEPKAGQTAPKAEIQRGAEPMKREAAEPNKAPTAAQIEKREEPNRGQNANQMQKREGQAGEANKAAETKRREEQMKTGQGEHKEPGKAAEGKEHNAGARAEEPNNPTPPHRNEAMRPGDRQNRIGAEEQKGAQNRMGAEERNNSQQRVGGQDNGAAGKTGQNERGERQREGRGQPRVTGDLKMSPEHASRVTEVLERSGHRERTNIEIHVGSRVPETVRVYPLPPEVVTLAPEYRGYDYFIDDEDKIVFVSPSTHEIVGSINYEGRAAAEDSSERLSGARPCPVDR